MHVRRRSVRMTGVHSAALGRAANGAVRPRADKSASRAHDSWPPAI
jgi:hypothetical protein